MRSLAPILLFGLVSTCAAERLNYPKSKIVEQVDVYHGVRVADPYRWLEDANSADTRAWIDAENAVTAPFLAALPQRAAIHDRLTKLWNYERYSGVFKEGGRYFWQRNDGLQDRPVLYTSRTLTGQGEVLIDPNKFQDRTLALAGVSVSPDGKVIASRLQRAGSDWIEVEFLDIESRKSLSDRLKWVKFSAVVWSEDAKGVYYARYDEPNDETRLQSLNYNQKLFYHRIGTVQSDDKLIYFRPENKEWMYGGYETEDRKYLIIDIGKGSERNNAVFYRKAGGGNVIELLPKFDAMYRVAGSEGSRFFIRTNKDAPRGRVVEIDIEHPEPSNWKEIIAENEDSLQGVSYVNGIFIASYLKDAKSDVRMFSRTGKHIGDVKLPGIGRTSGFGGRQKDTEVFYTFTGYTFPSTVYRFDLKSRTSSVFKQPKVPADLAPYTTELVFYNSKDGTRIPMFLTYRKGLKRDGSNPVYLYGYGGFNIPVAPGFTVGNLVWLEMGAILAMPGIRGGGEYGTEWHVAGTKLHKQNVFDDFIAAAEYLVANKYSNPKRIAIAGGSNGGLLVAACLLQRPDLFGAAWPAVGVLDMLRFHKFTIGWGWVSDYGSADNPEEFKALYAYSPYHNVKKGVKYPATLITTADHDDRVVPAHSFKFAAALQAAQEGDAPILIRIQTKAGHGAGKPLSMAIEEQADVMAFLARHIGIETPFAKPSN